ncbi:hypothetical protein CYMTET_50726 [Cymbomonas tetramitiformis]|uniref:Kinesin motor domain-containing protein n=1 Tax=Cymbomonas tetramitiformis TaxID=36881 RepID=A0AAE0BP72_9CHLO|nr:hypothetical protein CYMTET_50726 [Cymbomonas tetramitiformis]
MEDTLENNALRRRMPLQATTNISRVDMWSAPSPERDKQRISAREDVKGYRKTSSPHRSFHKPSADLLFPKSVTADSGAHPTESPAPHQDSNSAGDVVRVDPLTTAGAPLLQGDEAGLRAHVAELERSVAVAAQQLEEQTSRYEQERQRVRLLVRALESRSQGAAAKDLDAKSTLAVQEMEAVQQEAAVARQEAETLREKLKKAEDEANATRQNVQSLSEKLATAEVEAKNAEDEANATRQKAQSLSEKLATAEVEASEARLQGAAAQEEAATARQQAVIAQRTAAGGQEKVAAAQEAASRLRQQVAVAWGERDVAREAAQKSEELRQAAREAQEEADVAKKELSVVQQELMLAQREAIVARESLEVAQPCGREEEARVEEARVECAAMSERLTTARDEAAVFGQEAVAARDEAASARSQLSHMQGDHASLVAKLESGEVRKAELEALVTSLSTELQALHAQVTSATALISRESIASPTAQDASSSQRQLLTTVEQLSTEHAALKQRYLDEAHQRRHLYNELMEMRGNIRVFCRCRPLSSAEMHAGDDSAITFDPQRRSELSLRTGASAASKKEVLRRFHFDRIYPPESTQAEVFQDAAPVVTSVLDGYNTCILAYGQTGTGKTYTIWGSASGDSRGVNARTLEALFSRAEERQQEVEYSFHVSMLEVYNEQLRDLLPRDDKPCKLEVRQGNGEVQGLQEVGPLQGGMEEVRTLLSGERTSAKLWLVDLAGSERLSRTEASGQRLKEAQHINKSLSALGDCIAALSSKSAHIPYRNSKLTQLLQDSLGGDAKTLMFVQASPALPDAAETLCSLNFAARAKAVDTGPAKRHADGGSGQMKLDLSAAQKKVEELQAEKAQTSIVASALKQQLEDLSAAQKKVEELQAEKAQTSTEASALKQQLEEERRSREALEERVRELRNSPAWSTSGCTSVARYTGLAPPAVTGDPRGGRVAFEFGTSSMADISPTAATTVAKPPHSSMPVEDAAPPPNLIVPAAPPPNLVVAPAPPANPIVPVTPHPSLTAAASPFSKPKEAESATPLNSVMATAPSPIRKKRRALSTATPGKWGLPRILEDEAPGAGLGAIRGTPRRMSVAPSPGPLLPDDRPLTACAPEPEVPSGENTKRWALKRKLAEPPDAEKPHPGAGLAPHKRVKAEGGVPRSNAPATTGSTLSATAAMTTANRGAIRVPSKEKPSAMASGATRIGSGWNSNWNSKYK